MKKYFCISDVHGYYQEMIDSLVTAGYDENNDNHVLVVLGDLFDRGRDSKKVYKYLRKLSDEGKAIILKGNHELMFIDFLKGGDAWFNFNHNGMRMTFDDFLDRTASFESYIVIDNSLNLENIEEHDFDYLWNAYQKSTREYIFDEFPDILDWLDSRPDYFETKNYIFTHGSIDTEVKDWHKPEIKRYTFSGWQACHWDDGSFYSKEIYNTDKTIVVGHFSSDNIREKYQIDMDNYSDNKILVREDGRVVYIDACTPRTKRVNVYIIEDDENE